MKLKKSEQNKIINGLLPEMVERLEPAIITKSVWVHIVTGEVETKKPEKERIGFYDEAKHQVKGFVKLSHATAIKKIIERAKDKQDMIDKCAAYTAQYLKPKQQDEQTQE